MQLFCLNKNEIYLNYFPIVLPPFLYGICLSKSNNTHDKWCMKCAIPKD